MIIYSLSLFSETPIIEMTSTTVPITTSFVGMFCSIFYVSQENLFSKVLSCICLFVCFSVAKNWSSALAKVWSDNQCTFGGRKDTKDLSTCKSTCEAKHVCTAVNFNPNRAVCFLRLCKLPIPSPTWDHGQFRGYHILEGSYV